MKKNDSCSNFKWETSAIILVDFQNQWTRPGLYNSFIRRELNRRQVIENTVTLVAEARRNGATIIHAPLVIDPKNKRGAFAHITFGKVFRKGSQGAEIDFRIWHKSDKIVAGRTAFDAFVNSDLEKVMRNSGCKQFFLVGFSTDQCVKKTIKTALSKEFDIYFVSDCCATLASFLQNRVERDLADKAVTSKKLLLPRITAF